jgi:hypothetical protein
MRPRTELAIASGGLVVLILATAMLGRLGRRPTSRDTRTSTFLHGPLGASAIAEALPSVGVDVRRIRVRQLVDTGGPARREALAVLNPVQALQSAEAAEMLAYLNASGGGDLILTGPAVGRILACLGYGLNISVFDSTRAAPPLVAPTPRSPWVHRTLERRREEESTQAMAGPLRRSPGGPLECPVSAIARTDTLLVNERGRPVALRLTMAPPGHTVTIVADENLFRNETLRRTDAGEFVLGLFARRYDRVLFDEYHQGFGPEGSLMASLLAWSTRSPFGWAVWQLIAVGLVALAASALRFGPAMPSPARRRRAPLEHVQALATALAAARGHDVAMTRLVQGLRRRLMPAGRMPTGDWRAWLGEMRQRPLPAPAHQAFERLETLTLPGATEDRVRQAALAVEDVWETLRS